MLKGEVFPADNVNVAELLDELEGRRFILRYKVNGRRLIQICSFTRYQRPDRKERDSEIPPPDGWVHPNKKRLSVPDDDPGLTQGKVGQNPGLTQGKVGQNPGLTQGKVGQNPGLTQGLTPGLACSGIRDPGSGIRDPDPPSPRAHARSNGDANLTGHGLLALFGRIRNEVFPSTLPWSTARDPKGDAGTFAAMLDHSQAADVEKTMRLALEHIRDGVDGWSDGRNADPSFAFGAWKSAFHALREEAYGVLPVGGNSGGSGGRPKAGLSDTAKKEFGL